MEELYTRRQGRGEQSSGYTYHPPRVLCNMNYQHNPLRNYIGRLDYQMEICLVPDCHKGR
jgi:hypothetical protein